MPEPIVGSAEDLEAGRVEPPDRKVAEDATVGGDAQRVADAPGRQIVNPSRRQRRDQLVRARAFNSDPRHETEIKQSRRRTAAHGLGANVAIVCAQRRNIETAIHHGSTRVWPDRTTTMTPARTRASATSRAGRTAGARVRHARTWDRSEAGLAAVDARQGEAWHRQNTADTAAADQYSCYERDRDDHYHR